MVLKSTQVLVRFITLITHPHGRGGRRSTPLCIMFLYAYLGVSSRVGFLSEVFTTGMAPPPITLPYLRMHIGRNLCKYGVLAYLIQLTYTYQY